MTNFDFLKKVDKDLFEIITDAERLYTSEFFEQCISQTRRFGEQLCRSILKGTNLYEETFDQMLATLKDRASSIQEKEFIEDLYFLKKQGNISVHSANVKQDGILALECLQRAFEASINYAVFYKNASKTILKKQYDIELLVTGKRSLKDKYISAKEKQQKVIKPIKTNPKKSTKQIHTMKTKPQKKSNKAFWIFVGISLLISVILLILICNIV